MQVDAEVEVRVHSCSAGQRAVEGLGWLKVHCVIFGIIYNFYIDKNLIFCL